MLYDSKCEDSLAGDRNFPLATAARSIDERPAAGSADDRIPPLTQSHHRLHSAGGSSHSPSFQSKSFQFEMQRFVVNRGKAGSDERAPVPRPWTLACPMQAQRYDISIAPVPEAAGRGSADDHRRDFLMIQQSTPTEQSSAKDLSTQEAWRHDVRRCDRPDAVGRTVEPEGGGLRGRTAHAPER